MLNAEHLIIHAPRFPFAVAQLMPPSGLAEVAGALLHEGHSCRILDYGTLDAVAFFANSSWRDVVNHAGPRWWAQVPAQGGLRRLLDASVRRATRQSLQQHLETERARWYARIVAEIREYRGAQSLLFHAQNRADWLGVLAIAASLRIRGHNGPMLAFGEHVSAYADWLCGENFPFDALCIEDPAPVLAQWAGCAAQRTHWRAVPNLLLWESGRLRATPRRHWQSHAPQGGAAYRQAVYPAFSPSQKILLPTFTQSQGADWPPHALPESYWYRRHPVGCDADALARQIEAVAVREKCAYFAIQGAGAAGDADSLAEALRRSRLPLGYAREISITDALHGNYRVLLQSGCQAVSLRTPTASQRLLEDFFGCGFGVSEAEAALRRLGDRHMHATLDMIFPVPEDDYHTIQELLRFVARSQPDAVRFQAPQVLPGARWWQQARDFGFTLYPRRFARWVAAGDPGVCYPEGGLPQHYAMRGWPEGAVSRQLDAVRGAMAATGKTLGHISPQEALLAKILGRDGRAQSTVAALQRAIYALDVTALRRWIEEINRLARKPELPDSLAAVEAARLKKVAAGN